MRSAPLTVSVLIQVGWVARTDAGAVGDRGPGGMGVGAVLSRLRSAVRSEISAAESLRSARPGGKLISAVERQLRCGRGAVI